MQRHHPRTSTVAVFALATLFWLCLSGTASAAAPANDDFANAATLSGLSATATGSNVDATTEPGEPYHLNGNDVEQSVWWKWTAPADADVNIETCGSSFDTVLAVYTGSSVDALTLVESNGDAYAWSACTQHNSRLSFAAHSGETYRIAVDGFDSYQCISCSTPDAWSGDITLALEQAPKPANDDFADSATTDVTNYDGNGKPIKFRGFSTTAGASKEPGEPDHAGEAGSRSVWWNWTAPRSDSIAFSAASSIWATAPSVAVYTGDAIGDLTEVASTGTGGWTVPPASFEAVAGKTYHIAVGQSSGQIGEVSIRGEYRWRPYNDDFQNASSLSGMSAEEWVVLEGSATNESGEPNHAGNAGGGSLWWRWKAPVNATVQIDVCERYPDSLDTVLAVYTGSAVGDLRQVAANDDAPGCGLGGSMVEFNAKAETTYRFAVDRAAGEDSSGYFALSLNATPVAPPPPPRPSNEFGFGKVSKNKRKGTARLTVNVPGPGELNLAKTARVRAAEKSPEAAGEQKLLVKPRRGAKRRLLASGRVKVTAKLTYTPERGEPNTKRVELLLRLRAA